MVDFVDNIEQKLEQNDNIWASGGSRILKGGRKICVGGRKGGADFFRGGDGRGADFEGLYYQSRSDCTRPKAVMGVGAGGVAPLLGGPGVLPPETFLICECPHVHFLVLKGHILARKVY